jgi:rhodanese-related sulfurtransferase
VTVEPEPTSSPLPELSKVTVKQVQQWMEEGEPLVFLDSRNEASWSAATTRVPGSLRVPPTDVEPYLSQIPRDRRIIVYCT